MGIVVALDVLGAYGAELRGAGKRIVFTTGHFDLLLIGHVRYLQSARAFGDVLVVGVNDDASTTARKGEGRPIVPAMERAELLAALACVDAAVLFPDLTAEAPITLLRPDVYVKGGDYAVNEAEESAGKTVLPEAPLVRSYGGVVRTVPLVAGRSTTDIVRHILRTAGCVTTES
jgi:rfaE bifunctional protein nucleotidyltransferase chain/domain